MKELFLILLFSKTVLLTPVPVNISGEIVIRPNETLKAITPGASLDIDVSEFTGHMKIKEKGILEVEKLLASKIPAGSVKAVLHGSKGEKVLLNESGFALTNEGAKLVLFTDSGVPTNVAFNKVTITSSSELKGVRVYWKNYKH